MVCVLRGIGATKLPFLGRSVQGDDDIPATVKVGALNVECRWFNQREIVSTPNIIPSLHVAVDLEQDVRGEKLDFFFMEDTIGRRGARLELTHCQLQAFRRIDYVIREPQNVSPTSTSDERLNP